MKSMSNSIGGPDKVARDRECDTYQIRVAALKLRDEVDAMAEMAVNSGTQLTALKKLHAASVDRQTWSQGDAWTVFSGHRSKPQAR